MVVLTGLSPPLPIEYVEFDYHSHSSYVCRCPVILTMPTSEMTTNIYKPHYGCGLQDHLNEFMLASFLQIMSTNPICTTTQLIYIWTFIDQSSRLIIVNAPSSRRQ
jgi:hypothetical protein